MKHIALMTAAMPFALCGCAELEIKTTKSMPSGTTQTVAFITDLRRDCSPIDVPQARVVETPHHGSLTIVQVDDFPRYDPDSPLEQCDSTRTTGLRVSYTPHPAYIGIDQFSYDAIANHRVIHARITENVL